MKLIDLFSGTPGDDPKDTPSGVKLVVEPSAGLLEIVDDFRKHGGQTREAALLSCAALGAVSKKVVGGIFDALTGGGSSKPRSDDDFAARKAELDAKQLVLTKALAKKEALEEAVEACEKVVTETLEKDPGSLAHTGVAISCANAMRDLQRRVVEEVDEAFKKLPTSPDLGRANRGDVLEEAARACDKIAAEFQKQTGSLRRQTGIDEEGVRALIATRQGELVANACGKAVRGLNTTSPPLVDFKRVVGSAAQRECHYAEPDADHCRKRFLHEIDWPKWCAACVCKHALPETWGTT